MSIASSSGAANVLCPNFGTRQGCKKGSRCKFLHVNTAGLQLPSQAARIGAPRNFPGCTVMLREYIGMHVRLPFAAYSLSIRTGPLARLDTTIMQEICLFLGQTRSSTNMPYVNCPRPHIIVTPTKLERTDRGAVLRVPVRGGRAIDAAAWHAQLAGQLRLNDGRLAYAATRPGLVQDLDGSSLLWHCTSIESALRILYTGELRTGGPHRPNGIYSAIEPASFYDLGARVRLRMVGVVASRSVSRSLTHSHDMIPLGLIAVIERSVQEWVCHPRACEVVEICFHYAALRAHLQQTPLAAVMELPAL